MPKEGQVWPLQLVCLLLLVLGLLAFIDPTVFGQKAPISREAALLLLGGSVLTGIVLYSPVLTEIFKAGGVGGAITQRIGNPANPAQAQNSVIGRLQAVQTQTNAIGDPNAPNSVIGRLQAIQTQIVPLAGIPDAIGDPKAPQAPQNSMVGLLRALQTQISALAGVSAAIGISDDPAQTVQKRLGDIETRLGTTDASLQAGIKDLSERLDRVAAKLPAASGG